MNLQAGPVSTENFGFSAKPKVVKPRTKYRETIQIQEEEPDRVQNIMFEKRVVRGNTHARIIVPKDSEAKDIMKSTKSVKRSIQIQKEVQDFGRRDTSDIMTPRAVQGRQNIEVQTDEFVEMLTDKPPEYEKDTQTEVFIDRPNPRLFVPRKTGIDQETQIWDGDLFDFDYEVEPILQVLLGKTLEQSRMEVLEEEELRVMKQQQKQFEQLRNAELAEMQRLEAKEKRLVDESDRRRLQYRKQKEQSVLSHKKMICRSVAKGFLSGLRGDMIEMLEDQGVFRDPLQMSLQDQFLPWLIENVRQELVQESNISQSLERLCVDVVSENERIHKEKYDEEMKRREDKKLADIKRKQDQADRREQRRLEKLRQIEIERRNKIRDDVAARILSKAEVKENVLSQLISDIDGNQQPNRPFVGLVGGLVGEFVLFLSSLTQSTNVDVQQSLRTLVADHDAVQSAFSEVLKSVLAEGSVDLPISNVVDAQLESIVSGLSLATLPTAAELTPEQIEQIKQVLAGNVASVTLNAIKANAQSLGVSVDVIARLVSVIVDTFFSSEAMKLKIKLSAVQADTGFGQAAGIALIQPDIASLPLNPKLKKVEEVPAEQPVKTGEEDQQEEQESAPKAVEPKSLAESEFANRASVFVPKDDQLEVLVQHAVAEQVVRASILRALGTSVASIAAAVTGNEAELLLEAESVAKSKQSVVIESIHSDFPVLDMQSY